MAAPHRYYWDRTQRIYREELDPDFDGAAGPGPVLPARTEGCDADVYGEPPPSSRTLEMPQGVDPATLLSSCPLRP